MVCANEANESTSSVERLWAMRTICEPSARGDADAPYGAVSSPPSDSLPT